MPEDRHLHGLFKIADVAINTTSALLSSKTMGKFILNKKKEREITQQYINDFRIKVTGQSQLTGSLSGGNQQKVILARWLLTHPEYLILDEPTRGIDVGTKVDIQKLVLKLASEGMSVTFISSETDEMLPDANRRFSVPVRKITIYNI